MSEFAGVLLWVIPGLPLAAAVATAFLGPKVLRQHSHWPCVLAVAGSCLAAVVVFLAVAGAGAGQPVPATGVTWFQVEMEGVLRAPTLDIRLGLRADALTAIMLVMITFIGSLIAIFSIGYMHEDAHTFLHEGGHGKAAGHGGHGGEHHPTNYGYPRFFAEISLFVFMMTMLVLADNFIVLYLGWEGVGLCSYLLIGYWFTKPAAADAARKAFLVTRIGDVGLLLGILLLWTQFGYHLDYDNIFAQAAGKEHGVLVAACLFLFCGAAGKSAQFPLHVWLPDAMEGPTPVSALIHAATMVTAGVYLVARCTPLFVLAPEAQLVVAVIGGFTALMAALIALTQTDLKRVLAYSTLSQLGYMFLALGSAVGPATPLVTFAVVAAIFHLFTHAFFKALLFLSAGSVMHAMGNVIDMRRFGGLHRVLPWTHGTFLVGALALAGIIPLSGFWSKDLILGAAFRAYRESDSFGMTYRLLGWSALITAGLTAFYTFRAYFLTFWGPERVPPEAGEHAHESPPVMTVPLVILAVFAAGVGIVLGPTGWFEDLLVRSRSLEKFAVEPEGLDWPMMLTSTGWAAGGLALAWRMYFVKPGLADRVAGAVPALYQLSLNKFHFDELYQALIVRPLEVLAQAARVLDFNLVDSLVDLIGQLPAALGRLFRPVQNGLVQFYALAMVLGLTVFILALVRTL